MTNIFKNLSALQIAFTTFFCLICLFFFLIGIFQNKPTPEFDIVYQSGKQQKKSQKANSPDEFLAALDKDKNVRYAERLREASALMLALSLSEYFDRLSTKQVNNKELSQVIEKSKQKGLLPDFIQVIQGNQVATNNGIFYINYSVMPFALEIISVGVNGENDGDVFVLRLPGNGIIKTTKGEEKTGNAVLWVSPNSSTLLPPAFADETTYLQSGWKKESLKIGNVQIPQK